MGNWRARLREVREGDEQEEEEEEKNGLSYLSCSRHFSICWPLMRVCVRVGVCSNVLFEACRLPIFQLP